MQKILQTLLCSSLLLSGACAGSWKISGGPPECLRTCQEWDMDLQGMVAVGSQGGATARGATACVCQARGKAVSSAAIGAAASAALAGPIEDHRKEEEDNKR